jgi:hypothetical protein
MAEKEMLSGIMKKPDIKNSLISFQLPGMIK